MGAFCSSSTKSVQDASVDPSSSDCQVSLGTLTEDPLLLEMGFDSRVSRLYDAVEVVQDEDHNNNNNSKSTIMTICKVRRKDVVMAKGGGGATSTTTTTTTTSSSRALLLKRIVAENPVLMLRWYHTIDLYQTLQHPNLPRLIDVHDDEDDDDSNSNNSNHSPRQQQQHQHHVSFVMEMCEGGPILERSYSTEAQTRKVVRQILEVVKYLHAQNIVHGDLRAEWFRFESKDPKKWAIQLMDFSLARQLSSQRQTQQQQQSQSKFNKSNTAPPPPRVLHDHEVCMFSTAPECLLNGRLHSKSGDMWSVGIILYQLLSGGQLPFVGNTREDFINNIRIGNAPPTFAPGDTHNQECWDRVSTPAKNLIQKLLNLEPKARLTAQQALKHPWLSSFHGGRFSLSLITTR